MGCNLTDGQLTEYMEGLVVKGKAAQKKFEMEYTAQRPIDEVVRAIGLATCENAEELCREALGETGMGNLQGKIDKLKGAALIQWGMVRGKNTVEYEDCPGEPGVKYLPKPMGLIGCVMPSTNPVATIIGNAMMALKCRNAVIIAPHPASVKISVKMVNMLREALEKIGAPVDLIQCISIEAASIEATTKMLELCDCNIATGGAAMVKAVYSAGKPAFGVGQGNCQEILDRDITDEDLLDMVVRSIGNRSFDNGVPCTGDQTVHVPEEMEEKFVDLMGQNGAFVIRDDETIAKIRNVAFPDGGTMINRKIVGKLPNQIGEMAGVDIPESAKIILLKNQAWGAQDVLCREILCPIMRYTTYNTFEEAVSRSVETLEVEGAGHSSSIWSHTQEHIEYAAKRIPVGRFHINQPTGGCDNGLYQTITVGCGTWGGSLPSENLAYYHLMNKTKVTVRVPNIKTFMDASWDEYEPFSLID